MTRARTQNQTHPVRARTRTQVALDSFNAVLVGRQHTGQALMCALLGRQHAFLLGEPGGGKSKAIRAIAGLISGVNVFSITLDGATSKADVWGLPSGKSYIEEDVLRYNLNGRLGTARIALVDEFFRGRQVTATMLEALADRTFTQAGETIRLPLDSFIGGGNDAPDDEQYAAVIDRFDVRLPMRNLTAQEEMTVLTRLRTQPKITPVMTAVDLTALQQTVANMELDTEMREHVHAIMMHARTMGLFVSTRRMLAGYQMVCATAVHNGIVPDESCLESLADIFVPLTSGAAHTKFNRALREFIGQRVNKTLWDAKIMREELITRFERLPPNPVMLSTQERKNAVQAALDIQQSADRDLRSIAKVLADAPAAASWKQGVEVVQQDIGTVAQDIVVYIMGASAL